MAGGTVSFTVAGTDITATTDADGVARATYVMDLPAQDVFVQARFNGGATHSGAFDLSRSSKACRQLSGLTHVRVVRKAP